MSQEENQELNNILTEATPRHFYHKKPSVYAGPQEAEESYPSREAGTLVQWTTSNDKMFVPASYTKAHLPPGIYEIQQSSNIGIYFEKIPVRTEGLLRFPQTNSERIVKEIQMFWEKEAIFKEYKLAYKRGILLWGCPGGGKTSLLQILMKDVIDRDGVVVKFTNPGLFTEGMRIFREIQPTTPIVIMMEDIDSILDAYNESNVLNILDGVDRLERAVYLATTNYPQRLGARILNRPSRFDKRFMIGYPNAESRMLYLRHIIGDSKVKELKIDLHKWVRDTEKFSIAHLKELFVAVVILGDDYNEAIDTLRSMKEDISSDDDRELIGFGSSKYKSTGR
jgi:hypothetical protein